MIKPHSHLHARSYWGAEDSAPLIRWLNLKTRPVGDPVEELARLNADLAGFAVRAVAEEIRGGVAAIVRRAKLGVAPVVGAVRPGSWDVDWKPTGNMHYPQALALFKLLHLASRGLLDRVRKCPQCGTWFFGKFRHQVFDSAGCQQKAFRADPAYKKKHAERMKESRATKRLQEQKWVQLSKKRKGHKR